MPVEEYEERARRAIEKAVQQAGDGRSASAFAKRMREAVGNGPGLSAPARWLRRDEGHERIPAWALLAAADVAGVGLAELLEDRADDGRLARLEQRVEGLAGLVGKLQEVQDLQRKLLAQVGGVAEGPSGEGSVGEGVRS